MKMQETEVCDVCNKIVSDDDEGLLCEECLIWKHRVCLSIGVKLYQMLTKSEDPWKLGGWRAALPDSLAINPSGTMKMQETEVCDVCNKIVSDDDEGLLCEECLIWKHRVCLSIGVKLYQMLTKSEDPWVCDSCKTRHANTGTRKQKAKQAGTYTLADVMAKLEDMDRKYN
nr:unnamed protein product [Callosobruchus analis]